MSEQGSRSNHESEKLNLNQGDYKNTEEKLLLAFAQLRLLNDKEAPLSLNLAISRACQLSEAYRQWQESAATIKGIDVRLSNGQKITLSQANDSHKCGLRFNDSFPAGTVIHVWKKADDRFGEVLLLTLPLSNIPPHGFRVERKYPNGQALSLKVELCPDEVFSISVDFTEPEAQHASADAFRLHSSILPFALLAGLLHTFRVKSKLSLAYSLAATLIAMGFLEVNFLQHGSNLVRTPIFEPAAYSARPRANDLLTSKDLVSEKVTSNLPQDSTAISARRSKQSKTHVTSLYSGARPYYALATQTTDIP